MPRFGALGLAIALAGCGSVSEAPPIRYQQAAFADLAGWRDADPRPALAALLRGCPRSGAIKVPAAVPVDAATLKAKLAAACDEARTLEPNDAATARGFFERRFVPYRVRGPRGDDGLFTGYYEPEFRASRRRHGDYTVPIHALPPDTKPGTTLPTRAAIETSSSAKSVRHVVV